MKEIDDRREGTLRERLSVRTYKEKTEWRQL